MDRYLFRFGYCTPQQWAKNEAHGWDDESSYAFFVVADSADKALAWGAEVAEAFTAKLFEAAGWKGPTPSWKDAQFAHWIEDLPETVMSSTELDLVPVVRAGEFPDFSERWWRAVSPGENV